MATNEQARPVPIVYGSRRFGAQFISELFDKKIVAASGGGSSKGATKASDKLYHASFACLICAGPAYAVPRIVLNDEVIYAGYVAFGAAEYKDIAVATGALGRHNWTVRFYKGSETQLPDNYLITKSGVDHPAYRGWHYAVFHQMYFGLNQTDAPNVEFEPYILPAVNAWFTADVVFHNYALQHVNPAAIIADLLQNPRTGLALPDDKLDEVSFNAIGDQLITEKQVLHAHIDRVTEARSLVDQVLEHIDGHLVVGGDGKLGLALNRPGAAVPIVDEDVMLRRPRRTSANWLTAHSETRMKYHQPSRYAGFTGLDDPPYDKNLIWRDRGLVRITGEPSSVTVDRTLIREGTIARNTVNALGRRNAIPTTRATVSVRKVNGLFAALTPGSLFKLRLPSRGITEQICRVEERTEPSPGAQHFTIAYVVDYSHLNTTGAVVPADPTGEPGAGAGPAPSAPNVTFSAKRIVELPLDLCPEGKLSLAALVRRDNILQEGFAVWAEKNFAYVGAPPDSYGFLQLHTRCSLHGTLGEEYTAGDEVETVGMLVQLDGVDLTIDAQTDWDAKSNNLLAFIEDEIVSIHTVELVAEGWYRLKGVRGRFATTNATHAADTDVFIIDRRNIEPIQHPLFVPGYTVTTKLAPTQSGAQADLADVTASDYEIVGVIALSGTGSPAGVVIGKPGMHYWQTDTETWWIKHTGDGSKTGWIEGFDIEP